MNISQIEALTINDVEDMRKEGKAELINIKDHQCYFVDLGGAFGYSVLVFKNDHYIYYANDYQLHHNGETIEELKEYYIKSLSNKLFTESELMEDIKSYDEYNRKDYYVRNYWIMQFDHVSAFYIGKPGKELQEAEKTMFYCPTCFCYVKDQKIIDKTKTFIEHIKQSFAKIREDAEIFRKMISYELANHEACYTEDYTDALRALGLKYEKLTEEQQRIVNEELNKQVACYY